MASSENPSRTQFLLRNLLRGALVLALFVVAFILFRKYGGVDYLTWLEPVYSRPLLVFGIYTLSEILFGIITPEIFMAWGLEQGDGFTYILILLALMFISYGAGWLNYFVGLRFRKIPFIKRLIDVRLSKYMVYLKQYGAFLIIVAAVTPLPFAAICLLVGSADYNTRKFLLYSLFRLGRFMVYGYIVWGAGQL